MKIEFGIEYRDKITEFTGTCVGKSTFISGCDQDPARTEGRR